MGFHGLLFWIAEPGHSQTEGGCKHAVVVHRFLIRPMHINHRRSCFFIMLLSFVNTVRFSQMWKGASCPGMFVKRSSLGNSLNSSLSLHPEPGSCLALELTHLCQNTTEDSDFSSFPFYSCCIFRMIVTLLFIHFAKPVKVPLTLFSKSRCWKFPFLPLGVHQWGSASCSFLCLCCAWSKFQGTLYDGVSVLQNFFF